MITSRSNEQVKFIRKLMSRKSRDESGLFYIEGLRIIGKALEKGEAFHKFIYSPELVKGEFAQTILKNAASRGLDTLELSKEVFLGISLKENPQGLCAILKQRVRSLDGVDPGVDDLWVALDEVQDPGNLGTILRTADAVGAKGVILLDYSTDPYDPTSIRASMGAIFSQAIVRSSLKEFIAWKDKAGISIVGTSDKAEQDYHVYPYPSPIVLLMGSERQGLDAGHIQICNEVVKIPMQGESDSLNLAIATAIVLYEIFNQRREKVKK